MSYANLYFNKSDHRVMNKTLELVNDDVGVYLIENADTMEPVLKLSKNISFRNFNYVYLSFTDKYYYVSKPPTMKEGFYEIPLHEDVLYTHRAGIKNCYGIIKRNQYRFDLYLNDEKMKLKGYQSIRTLKFPYPLTNTAQQFVLGLVGGSVLNGGGGNG